MRHDGLLRSCGCAEEGVIVGRLREQVVGETSLLCSVNQLAAQSHDFSFVLLQFRGVLGLHRRHPLESEWPEQAVGSLVAAAIAGTFDQTFSDGVEQHVQSSAKYR